MKNKLVLAGVAVLVVLFALSYLGSTKVYTVTYTVTGETEAGLRDALKDRSQTDDLETYIKDTIQHQSATVTVQNASGGSEQMSVALPYTMTVERHGGDFLYLSAQADKGTPFVDVEIRSNGVLVQHSESIGEYAIATASGKVQ